MSIITLKEISWKKKRIQAIDRLSKKKGWTYGDGNPYFQEVWTHLPKSNAKSLSEYKKEIKLEKEKNEKINIFNVINSRLLV